jgi:hypothetical protein
MSARRVPVKASIAVLACIITAIAATPAAAHVGAASKKPAFAEVRVVHMYAPAAGSEPTLVVVDNQASVGKKKPKPLIEAEFGDVTDFTKVPTGHTLRIGLADDNSGIFIDPLKKGDRITVIPFATSDDPEETGFQMETIVERGKRQKAGDLAEWPKIPSGRATLMMFPGPLLSVAPDFGGFLVTPGEGCVETVDPSDQGLGVGGTIPAFYVVDAGSVDVGLADGGCDATADIGPETVDASAGDRIAVIPYGTSADDLQLLVLPVDTP